MQEVIIQRVKPNGIAGSNGIQRHVDYRRRTAGQTGRAYA
jgi:hypothetical protein